MRILYYETSAYPPVSPLFIESLEASGHEYDFVDEARFIRLARASIARRAANRLLSHALGYRALNREMLARARAFSPDLVLVGKGNYLSPATLASIKRETGATLVNYATDDPFNRNSRAISMDLVESVPLYDLYASTKKALMPDLRRRGCANVAYVPFAYKPTVHFPERAQRPQAARFDSDVAFIGGCDADRAPLFEDLVRLATRHSPASLWRLLGAVSSASHVLARVRLWSGFSPRTGRDEDRAQRRAPRQSRRPRDAHL